MHLSRRCTTTTISRSSLAWLCLWIAHLVHTARANTDDPDEEPASSAGYDDDVRGNFDMRAYLFQIFRFGLFFFIICFPCLRAIRVWFLAGGRIRWRRTRGGWIIGLRYQAADLDRWLVLSGYHNQYHNRPNQAMGSGASATNRKLTPEEVYSLPEILAPKPPVNTDDDDVGVDAEASGDIEMGAVASKDDGLVGGSGDGDNNDNSEDNHESSQTTTPPEASPGDAASSPAPLPDSASVTSTATPTTVSPLFTTTLSTSCSICLDDFEEGERLRLLPKCGHAFHTDCILPWLTERQGCCPYCKAAVVCPPATTTEVADTDLDDEAAGDDRETAATSAVNDAENGVRIPTSSTSTRYPYNSFIPVHRNRPYNQNGLRTI